MVTVNRQAPPAANSAPAVASVLHRAIPVNKMARAPLKILIYGGNGVGKNTLAAQWPKPMLLVSFEPGVSAGLPSIDQIPGINLLHVVPDSNPMLKRRGSSDPVISMDETQSLALDIAARPDLFKTIVLDGLTSWQDAVGANMLGLPDIPDQRSWGNMPDRHYIERSENIRNYVRKYLDLPIDTIFLGKEKDHNPPREEKYSKDGKLQPDMRPRFLRGVTDKSFVSVDMGGGPAGWIVDACDYACRLYVGNKVVTKTRPAMGKLPETQYEEIVPDEFVRYLRMAYHPNYGGRVRTDLNSSLNMPDEIENPTYEKFMAVIGRTPQS